MADYTATPILIDWYDPFIPPTPPTPLSDPEAFSVVTPAGARSTWLNYLGAKITNGYISYVKWGEGGWVQGPQIIGEQIDTANGGKVYSSSGVSASPIETIPVVFESLIISGGAGYILSDDGEGNLTGDGSGTVNYRTGEWALEFDSNLVGGQPILCAYRGWAKGYSDTYGQDIDNGTDSPGPYSGTVACAPVLPGSVTITDEYGQFVTDDGNGNLTGDGSGTINYVTGAITVTFSSIVYSGMPIRVAWKVAWAPGKPVIDRSDLVAANDSRLYTFTKSLTPGVDMVFQGAGSGAVRVAMALAAGEANDVADGDSPYFFEGGLFTASDQMVAYFTFPGFKKDSSTTWSKSIDLKKRP